LNTDMRKFESLQKE